MKSIVIEGPYIKGAKRGEGNNNMKARLDESEQSTMTDRNLGVFS